MAIVPCHPQHSPSIAKEMRTPRTLTQQEKTRKGEEKLAELGLYIQMPINLTVVLTPSESAVLNIIRHCNNIQTRVMSLSLFEVMSGMTENTVKKALTSLQKMELIEKGAVCKAGTYYSINYKTLYTLIWRLNKERNPVERMRIADSFRGEDDAINTKLIAKYTNSPFDTGR